MHGKRVVVVGIGNSGSDIAVETSRVAEEVRTVCRWPLSLFGRYTLARNYSCKLSYEAQRKFNQFSLSPSPIQLIVGIFNNPIRFCHIYLSQPLLLLLLSSLLLSAVIFSESTLLHPNHLHLHIQSTAESTSASSY